MYASVILSLSSLLELVVAGNMCFNTKRQQELLYSNLGPPTPMSIKFARSAGVAIGSIAVAGMVAVYRSRGVVAALEMHALYHAGEGAVHALREA